MGSSHLGSFFCFCIFFLVIMAALHASQARLLAGSIQSNVDPSLNQMAFPMGKKFESKKPATFDVDNASISPLTLSLTQRKMKSCSFGNTKRTDRKVVALSGEGDRYRYRYSTTLALLSSYLPKGTKRARSAPGTRHNNFNT